MDSKQQKVAQKPKLRQFSYDNDEDRFFEAKTEAYLKFAKVMFILQHYSRYDRNRLTERLIDRYGSGCYVCTDTPSRLEEFYLELQVWGVKKTFRDFCREEVRRACELGTNLVVVNLEYITDKDVVCFADIAEQAKYILLAVPPVTRKKEPSRSSNFYLPPAAKICHEFFGWYLNEMDSLSLREEALMYLKDCWNKTPDFANIFEKQFHPKDFGSHYQMETPNEKMAPVYCVAKVCCRNIAEAAAYLEETIAGAAYGTVATLRVVGFAVTACVLAAVVRLNRKQRELWELDDPNLCMLKKRHCKYLCRDETVEESSDEKLVSSSSKCKSTLRLDNGFHRDGPSLSQNERGRDANFLLGASKSAVLYNVRYDVVEAVSKHGLADVDAEHGFVNIGKAFAKGYGKYWLVVLKKPLAVDAVFASLCSTRLPQTQTSTSL